MLAFREIISGHLNHFFCPQESNNFKAKFLHTQSLSLLIVFYLSLQLVLSSLLFIGPKVLGYASNIPPEKVIELTNIERAKVGAPPLTLNPLLIEAAGRKAGDMYAFNYWAHVSPSSRKPWDFFREVGYNFSFAGENLARDFSSANDVVKAWMASPTHKENLLNPKYREIGVAVVDGTLGGAQTTLVVQLLGTTQSQNKGNLPLASEELPPTVTQNASLSSTVLSRATGREVDQLNPFALSKTIGFSVLGIVAGVLLLDAFLVWKGRVVRLSGRPVAHFLFLFGMILIILLSEQGIVI